ncbi:MAG: [Fe-S]-binding protein [Deltaproteobacteria bacterium]|nr:[Fe-S]-binding protein [Deltaproteobacteria bacterium]
MTRAVPAAAFLLTAGSLFAIQAAVARPMLLAERFVPGAGWVEAAALAIWAAVLARRMLDPRRSGRWRRRAWTLFSAVFFGQLVIGLAGVGECLMTGDLHLPVPALIVAGPIWRGGEGLFMPILFLATVVLVGPAWCSHLCYLGAWDGFAAIGGVGRTGRRPFPAPRRRPFAQAGIAAAVVATALVLRLGGAPPALATGLAAAFGIGGVIVMIASSRRTRRMDHCTTWCPVGLVATLLGRALSPWRMRLAPGCDGCGSCAVVCRYDALRPEHVRSGRPGPSCTLCGDCVRPCRGRFVEYRLPGLGPDASRALFLVLVSSLHAIFLGVARI